MFFSGIWYSCRYVVHLFSEHRYVNIVGVVEKFDGDVEHQRVVCSRCDTKTARYGKNVDVLRFQRLNKHGRKMIVRHFYKRKKRRRLWLCANRCFRNERTLFPHWRFCIFRNNTYFVPPNCFLIIISQKLRDINGAIALQRLIFLGNKTIICKRTDKVIAWRKADNGICGSLQKTVGNRYCDAIIHKSGFTKARNAKRTNAREGYER